MDAEPNANSEQAKHPALCPELRALSPEERARVMSSAAYQAGVLFAALEMVLLRPRHKPTLTFAARHLVEISEAGSGFSQLDSRIRKLAKSGGAA